MEGLVGLLWVENPISININPQPYRTFISFRAKRRFRTVYMKFQNLSIDISELRKVQVRRFEAQKLWKGQSDERASRPVGWQIFLQFDIGWYAELLNTFLLRLFYDFNRKKLHKWLYTLVNNILIYKTFVLSSIFHKPIRSNGLTSLAHQEFSIPPIVVNRLQIFPRPTLSQLWSLKIRHTIDVPEPWVKIANLLILGGFNIVKETVGHPREIR